MDKLDKNTGIDEELKKGPEATEHVSVEKLEADLKEKQEHALSGAEKKKEEIWQQTKDEVKRVEAGVGDTRGTEEEVAEAKQSGEELKNKGSEAEGELKSTLEIVMEKYKAEMPLEETMGKQLSKFRVKESKVNEIPEQKAESQAPEEIRQRPGSYETVTYDDIMKRRAEEAAEVEQKVGAEKQKEGVVKEAVGKGAEGEKLRKELDEARKALTLMEKNDPKYPEAQKDYQAKKGAMQNVAYEAKKATLLKKGLSETDVEKELDKYTREVLAPNFTVAEAAKIQAARSEANPSILEKMKDNKFSKLAYGAIDAYRKANWKKKIALSVGLLGVGVAAGATGGTVGLALAGIVTGGKGIQRFLSGAGTAVATEALIQRSQQKWMEKEGWGKNRHEYIAKQIASMRESAKKGGVLSEAEVEKSLGEREEIEKSNEARRVVLAGITGALVGSGAAWQAVKQAGEWTGASGVLGTAKDYWFGKAPKAPLGQDIAGKGVEEATPLPEEPVSLEIGARGPEGALIDNFRDNPDVAKAFGWDGKSDLSEWAGAKAGELWNADAKEALKNPQILAQMEKLGFSKDAEGYAKMAHRIGKGVIQIDPTGKNIKFADMEYLKNVTKEAKTLLGAEVKAPVVEITPEVPAIVRDLVDQQALSEIESKMTPHIEEIIKGLKENGMSEEKITERMEFIAKAAAERAGVDLSALGKDVINVDALQQIMESPEGKLGAFLEKFSSGLQEGVKVFKGNINFQKTLELAVEEKGGWAKLLKEKNFFDIVYPRLPEGGRVVTEGEIVISEFYNKLSALVPARTNLIGKSLEDILKLVPPKEIFGGTAEELMEKK